MITPAQVLKQNIANILLKVKEGKILNKREQEMYAEWFAAEEAKRTEVKAVETDTGPAHTPVSACPERSRSGKINTKEWADFWNVNVRTIQRWMNSSLPVDEPVKMANHILSMRASDSARARAEAVIVASRASGQPQPLQPNRQAEQAPAQIRPLSDQQKLSNEEEKDGLFAMRARAMEKYGEAIEGNQHDSIRFWSSEFMRIDKMIRERETHEKRMGVATGEILPRDEVERIVWALAFWVNQSVERDIAVISPQLMNLTFPEEASAILGRYLAERRIVSAFSQALPTASNTTGVSLPDWLVEAWRDGIKSFAAPDGDDEVAAFEKYMSMLDAAKQQEDPSNA